MRSEGKDYYAIRAEDGKFYDRNGTGPVSYTHLDVYKRQEVYNNGEISDEVAATL